MTYLLNNIYAIPVPDDAHTFSFDEEGNLIYRAVFAGHSNVGRLVRLPPGSYEILFPTKGCSEEQAKSVVEIQWMVHAGSVPSYKDYTGEYAGFVNNPLKALASLLRSKGLDPEKNYLLIKKNL